MGLFALDLAAFLFSHTNQPKSWIIFTCCMMARRCWKTCLYREKPHLDSSFTPPLMVSSGVMDLNIKTILLKLPEENVGESFHDLGEEVSKIPNTKIINYKPKM